MRPGITWMIVGAVAVIVVFAGLDALRFAGGEPTPSEASATGVTTTRRGTDAEFESSSELQEGRLLRLIPGRVTSSFFSEMAVRFTVPPGWYGYQDNGVIVLGKALSPVAMGVNFRSGGIVVAAPPPSLVGSFARATRSLESTPGILVRDVSAVRIGGHPGRRYSLMLRRSVSVQGLFGFAVSLDPGEPDIIVLRVRQRTVVIRRGFDEDQERPAIERVIQSFRFSQYAIGSRKEIEQTGNEWARVFGTGRTCNRLMSQPACDWVGCETHAGPIPNCTPVSLKVQRSFAGAVVQDIVIRGERAAARFSNGETVRLEEFQGGGGWWIARVGGGRQFFE